MQSIIIDLIFYQCIITSHDYPSNEQYLISFLTYMNFAIILTPRLSIFNYLSV